MEQVECTSQAKAAGINVRASRCGARPGWKALTGFERRRNTRFSPRIGIHGGIRIACLEAYHGEFNFGARNRNFILAHCESGCSQASGNLPIARFFRKLSLGFLVSLAFLICICLTASPFCSGLYPLLLISPLVLFRILFTMKLEAAVLLSSFALAFGQQSAWGQCTLYPHNLKSHWTHVDV